MTQVTSNSHTIQLRTNVKNDTNITINVLQHISTSADSV